jgi:hypothetical protein
LVITGLLLREQARGLQQAINRLSEQVDSASGQRPEIDVAVQMLQIRRGRTDWSPKLASISGQIDPSLRLTELTGQTEARGRKAGLELNGVVHGGGAEMQPVSGFLEALRYDASVAMDFPVVKLGNLEGGGSARFQVLCGKSKEAP